jgi:hypothetical protein
MLHNASCWVACSAPCSRRKQETQNARLFVGDLHETRLTSVRSLKATETSRKQRILGSDMQVARLYYEDRLRTLDCMQNDPHTMTVVCDKSPCTLLWHCDA